MRVAALFLGAVLPMGLLSQAMGQSDALIDGADVEEIVNVARGYGSATLETRDDGNPKIAARIDGISYQIYFLNCDEAHVCEDINFYAGFLDNKPSLEHINAWNRDKRFGKAYLDDDLDAVVEMDVNMERGISRANLDATFGVWKLILEQYTDYIDFK